jgi:quercetin dioxygenase-like cupin family protein
MTGAVTARDTETQTVTKNFDAAIPNISGKSLVVPEVDYAPGAASTSHTHAKSAFLYCPRHMPQRSEVSARQRGEQRREAGE